MALIQKKTLKSKSFWLGVTSIVAGIVLLSKGQQREAFESIAFGLAVVCGRDAIAKVQ